MKKFAVLSIAAVTLALVGIGRPASASGIILYDSLPPAGAPSLPSQPYQAQQTRQFGELIQLTAGGTYDLEVTVAMVNWAYESSYQPVGTTSGFHESETLTLYNYPGSGTAVGSVIAGSSVSAAIPWRPEPGGGCSDSRYFSLADNACHNGALSLVTFSFSAVSLPGTLVYGLAFNTETYGYTPLGTPGPWNSLNFGLTSGAPTIGSNPLPDTAYWDTLTAGYYTDGGAAGVGVFRQDTAWAPYNAAAQFSGTEVPEPLSLLLVGTGLVGVARKVRIARRNK